MTTAVQIEQYIKRRDDLAVAIEPRELERKRAIARRITAAREKKGITRAELGRRVGASWPLVDRWEDAEGVPTTPGTRYLAKIADAIDVSASWLLGTESAAVETPDAYPALAEFLDGIEGQSTTAAEREQLRAQRWKNPPTPLSYHYLLSAIRAGVATEDAAAEAEITGAAFTRGVARGGKPLKKAKR